MILTNAQIVTRTGLVDGTVEVREGKIADIGCGRSSAPGAVDLEGDYLVPGLIDLHTDALQTHHVPRPGVRWPIEAAVASHDAQMAASGVTTVFDALSLGVGGEDENTFRDRLQSAIGELGEQHARELRAEHFLHLRLEVSHPDTARAFIDLARHPLLGDNMRMSSDGGRPCAPGKRKRRPRPASG